MRLSPPEPSFLDMRNAILAADTGLGGAHHALIWQVFAGRGMGFLASVRGSSDVSPVQDFHLPPNVLPTGTLRASPTSVNPGQAVTFKATFTDPDSKITGYGWDFDGNGTVDRATTTGSTTQAYSRAGDFSARERANDFRGGAGTASVKVHVSRGLIIGKLPKKGSKGRAKFRVTCELRCKVTAKLTLSKKLAKQLGLKNKRTVGTLKRTLAAGASKQLTIRLTRTAKRALKRHRRKSVKVTLAVKARYPSDGRSASRHKTVKIMR
jgi:hypothetical protein